MPDQLIDTLHDCFQIDRILNCNPCNLPLRASTYYSEDPFDKLFSAEPLTKSAWTGITLSLPEFQPKNLTKALEQAIYSTHTHKDTQPSASILILPDWKHTPYLTHNQHTNYIHKIVTLPHTHTTKGTQPRKYNLNIYIVANSKALTLLEPHNIQHSVNIALTQAYGHTVQTTLIDTRNI